MCALLLLICLTFALIAILWLAHLFVRQRIHVICSRRGRGCRRDRDPVLVKARMRVPWARVRVRAAMVTFALLFTESAAWAPPRVVRRAVDASRLHLSQENFSSADSFSKWLVHDHTL